MSLITTVNAAGHGNRYKHLLDISALGSFSHHKQQPSTPYHVYLLCWHKKHLVFGIIVLSDLFHLAIPRDVHQVSVYV